MSGFKLAFGLFLVQFVLFLDGVFYLLLLRLTLLNLLKQLNVLQMSILRYLSHQAIMELFASLYLFIEQLHLGINFPHLLFLPLLLHTLNEIHLLLELLVFLLQLLPLLPLNLQLLLKCERHGGMLLLNLIHDLPIMCHGQ